MSVLPGAEAIHLGAGTDAPATIVVCHGFTGTPASIRPWAEFMHKCGYTVIAPRLPGHGTSWQDLAGTGWPDWYAELERALDAAIALGKPVFVFGHSMGGTLALRLAQQRGADITGIAVCNPSVYDTRFTVRYLVPFLRFLLPTVRGIGSDIAKPGSFETSYPRLPLAALHSLRQLWKLTAAGLPDITVPIRVFRSKIDHVVDPGNSALVLSQVSSTDVADKVMPDSFHVVPLDYDAAALCESSATFVSERLKALQERP